jgi:hypothetical protein
MSLNNTPLTEISKTLLDCVQISVSTADLITGFPIEAPDGSSVSPTYSFASNLDTGLTRGSDGISAVVDTEVGLISGPFGNVGVGSIPTNYGGGEGVLFLSDAAVNPIGVPNGGSGGILYVSGTNLVYLNSSGATTVLSSAGTSDVTGPNSSIDEEVARYADSSGDIVTTSGVIYSGGQLCAGDGTSSVPSFAFTSSPNTGFYLVDGTDLGFSVNGVNAMTLSSSTMTLNVPMQQIDGTGASPSITFSSDGTSGLSGSSTTTRFSTGGKIGILVDTLHNIHLVGSDSAFGTGAEGVIKISDADVDPVGIPNGGSGGILYVANGGEQLRYLDASGDDIHVGGDLGGVGTVNDGQLLVWDDITGTSVVARSIITDSGGIAAVQSGTLTNPAYSFTGDTTTGLGLAAPGNLRVVGGGSTYLDITSSNLTFTQPVLFDHTSPSSAPSMSFSSDTSVGIFGTGANAQFVKTTGFSIDAIFNSVNNLSLLSSIANYGSTVSGVGVVSFGTSSTPPSTPPVGGGILFFTSSSMKWYNTSNVEVDITTSSIVNSVASSTDNAAVRFNGVGGLTIQDSSIIITDTDQIQCTAAQGYRFVSSVTSGLFSSGGDTLELASGGTTGLTLTSSGVTVASGHEVLSVDGSEAIPAISFTGDSDTGLYLSDTNNASISAGGTRGLTIAPNNNVSFGSNTPDFAGGQGVVYFSDVTTTPSGAIGSGAVLYVNGRNMYMLDAAGTTSTLTGINHAGSSTDHGMVRWSGTTGRHIQDTSSMTITDGNQMLLPDGTGALPAYRPGSSATGLSLNAGTLQIGTGAAQLSLNSSAIVSSVALTTDDNLRVGGSGGMTKSFSSPVVTSNVANVSGTFVWQQNGTSIMQTDTSENLDMLTNTTIFSGATGTFSMGGFDGSSNYELDLANTADSLHFRVGSTDILTVANNSITVSNIESATNNGYMQSSSGITYGYGFTASPGTAGLVWDSYVGLVANSSWGIASKSSAQMSIFSTTVPTGSKLVTWGEVVTAPTSLPSSGAYMYQKSGTFMRVVDDKKDVALNGPHARAKWTRTATITTGSDTLIDTLVDDTSVSNIMSVDTAAPGAGTITGTADTAGWWEVTAEAHWANDATGYRKLRILIGGVEVALATQNAVSVAGVETQQQVSACVNVAASAVMTVRVEQNSGGNLNVDVIASAVLLG